jgi:hypothetical protein
LEPTPIGHIGSILFRAKTGFAGDALFVDVHHLVFATTCDRLPLSHIDESNVLPTSQIYSTTPVTPGLEELRRTTT